MLTPLERLARSKSAADCSTFCLIDGKRMERHPGAVKKHEGGFSQKRTIFAKASRRSEYEQIMKHKSAVNAFLVWQN